MEESYNSFATSSIVIHRIQPDRERYEFHLGNVKRLYESLIILN